MPFSRVEKARFILFPFSVLYGSVVELRNLYYDRGWLPAGRLPAPAIAVGNLTVGGAGKTPVTGFLARMLEQAGKKVAVLALGYRRHSRETIILRKNSLDRWSPAETGDEPRVLARALSTGAVVIGWNRYKTAWETYPELRPDVYLLDDAYQYRQVQRMLDVLVVDGPSVGRKDYVIPAGRLREPFRQMRRADLIWITRVDQMNSSREEALCWLRRWSRAPVVFSSFVPQKLVAVDGTSTEPVQALRGTRVFAFCGIARPESFLATLNSAGAEVVGHRFFLDHHWFTEEELTDIKEEAFRLGANRIVTTEKDAVRLSSGQKRDCGSLFYLQIELKVENEGLVKNLLKNS